MKFNAGQLVKVATEDGYAYGTVQQITKKYATVKFWDYKVPRVVPVSQLHRFAA